MKPVPSRCGHLSYIYNFFSDPVSLAPALDPIMSVADPGEGQRGHAPPPRFVKNRQKKDGRQMQWLIFYVCWPPLSEVSGSATVMPSGKILVRDCCYVDLQLLRQFSLWPIEISQTANYSESKFNFTQGRGRGRAVHPSLQCKK